MLRLHFYKRRIAAEITITIPVMRDWTTAKAWLYRELTDGATDGSGTMETG